MTVPVPGEAGYALFDTAIGRCGIGWTAHGIAAVQLPEATEGHVQARLCQRLPEVVEAPPPPLVRRAMTQIAILLTGARVDLSDIPLDMAGVPPFHQKVYEAARSVPAGSTVTYGALAERIDSPGSARAVGQALSHNPFPIIVPCHRVLASGGRLGGFSTKGGVDIKLAMLTAEGAVLPLQSARSQLQFDTTNAVAQLRAADPVLAAYIDIAGPCQLVTTPTRSVFGGLAQAIVYQQLSNTAATTIHNRALALPGGSGTDLVPAQILGATNDELRVVGLSRPKQLALLDLAQRADIGSLPTLAAIRKMDNDEIIHQLTQVRGVGCWTAQMFLIFRLGRPDVLPADDYSVRKGFSTVYNCPLPAAEKILNHGERWRPYRTVASWYLWHAASNGNVNRQTGSRKPPI